MTKLRIVTALACLFVCAGLVLADNALKSGPQTGEKVPGPFHPLNVTGPDAGQKQCLYCKNGANPVAMIFARQVSEPLTTLIKRIDEATDQHQDQKMGSFVVFLGDADALKTQLKEMADKENIKHCVLSVDEASGPEGYNVASDADVTVVLYCDHTVKANYAFGKGELNDKKIDQIVSDVAKICPKDKE